MSTGYRQYWHEKIWYGMGIALAVLALYASSLFSYLLFHCIIEIVTVAVAFMLFGVTWNTREYLANGYLRLLGIGFAFIALIDMIHTLTYKGMGVFPDSSNLPTQLWIAARYLQAATLVAAPFFVSRKINDHAVIAAFVVADLLLLALIFSANFPDCYVDGKGLTEFKISSEYVITTLLLVSLYLFYRKRDQFNDTAFRLMAASIACMVASELAFTAYVSVYGFANLVGHITKLAAFYLIYRSILGTGFKDPLSLISREFEVAELRLQESEKRLRLTLEASQIGIWDWDVKNDDWFASPTYYSMLGFAPKEGATNKDEWIELVHPDDRMQVAEKMQDVMTRGRDEYRYEARMRHADGTYRWQQVMGVATELDQDGKVARVLGIGMDIDEHKRVEQELRASNEELARFNRAATGRELRMIDLKREINELCEASGQTPRYKLDFTEVPIPGSSQ